MSQSPTIDAAIEDAVQRLPTGYSIEIEIEERGTVLTAWHELHPLGNGPNEPEESIAACIDRLVSEAIDHAADLD